MNARPESSLAPAQPAHALFVERGWITIDLPDVALVHTVRDRLLDRLRTAALPTLERLEEYHTFVADLDRHVEIMHDLSQYYWSEGLGPRLIASHLSFFHRLIGLDLHVQKYPYLRAVRPSQPADAVPLHRDTYYGSSPYEISVFIPFTDLAAEAALRVVSGSHVEPDASYTWTRGTSSGVTPGSPRHRLGFPYAPKVLDPGLAARAEAVPLRVGQALLFPLSLVHGGGANTGNTTRFSTDIRVVNSYAPIEWSHSVHADYYQPLSTSAVSDQARRYLAANATPEP